MSWWIYLEDEAGATIETDSIREEGGVCVLGGQTEAELNVTYNYGNHFDFKTLHKLRAEEAVPLLQRAIAGLGDAIDPDYWKATEGNVKRALRTLLEFAEFATRKHIIAVFVVT